MVKYKILSAKKAVVQTQLNQLRHEYWVHVEGYFVEGETHNVLVKLEPKT